MCRLTVRRGRWPGSRGVLNYFTGFYFGVMEMFPFKWLILGHVNFISIKEKIHRRLLGGAREVVVRECLKWLLMG